MFLHQLKFSKKYGRISKGALERSLSSNQRKIGPHRKPPIHVILTLDPNKFAEKKQKCLQIDNITSFKPHISLRGQSWFVQSPPLIYDRLGETCLPCPPDTKAFLYYYVAPEKPRIAGELRLRVTSSDDPASFESGSDLLRSNGRPWLRPLYALPKYYNPLYEKLREDGLVPDGLDDVLSNLSLKTFRYRRIHHLYTLNDTFILDLSSYHTVLRVVTEQGMERVTFKRMIFDSRGDSKPTIAPYTGSVLVRFERSTLPEHEGTRTVVLRFLKIITPLTCVIPNYDEYIPRPAEGELHQKASKFVYRVWNINIDQPHPKSVCQPSIIRGLQLLWDA